MSDTIGRNSGTPMPADMGNYRSRSAATGRKDGAGRKLLAMRAPAVMNDYGLPYRVAGRIVALSAAVFAREPDGYDRPASEDEWLVPEANWQRSDDA